jgi:hypothetical protein
LLSEFPARTRQPSLLAGMLFGHRLLHFAGWDAQAGGPLGLIVGDQRPGDIVAVSPPLLSARAISRPCAGGSASCIAW